MNPIHGIAALIIRIWAAGVLITSIGSLPFYLIPVISSGQEIESWNVVAIINNAVWLVFGFAGWIAAPRLARLIYPNQHDNSFNVVINADTLVMLGSFLIGGFYLAQYVPALLTQMGAMLIELSRQDPSDPYELGRLKANRFNLDQFITQVLTVMVALWMALRPSHVAHIFSRLRQAGLYEDESKPQ